MKESSMHTRAIIKNNRYIAIYEIRILNVGGGQVMCIVKVYANLDT